MTCPSLPPATNGVYNNYENNYPTTPVDYSCYFGYVLDGGYMEAQVGECVYEGDGVAQWDIDSTQVCEGQS